MGIGPHNKQDLRGADNVLPLREGNALLQGVEAPHRCDEFFDVLAPALEEAAGLQRVESPHQETNDLLLLLEENAQLRKLAVLLSNLLGNLPEWAAREIEPEVVERLSMISDRLKAS
jgi:hypothetical protein